MDNPRSAIHAIKGYFYQFDKTILELLQRSDNDAIYIEGLRTLILKPSMIIRQYNVNIMRAQSIIHLS